MYKPTDEQAHAIALFRRGDSLKLNAYAGSGKTATLCMLSEQTNRAGLYLAFNKAIAAEAKRKFSRHVECSTIHSQAYRYAAPLYNRNGEKLAGFLNANTVASALQLPDFQEFPWHEETVRVSKRSYAAFLLQACQRFLHSADEEPGLHHIQPLGRFRFFNDRFFSPVQQGALGQVKKLWAMMRSPQSSLPLTHDGYLKVWALSRPRLDASYLLVDEAQDSNPVLLGVLGEQSAQIVFVGDPYQQIYEWRHAVNAMASVAVKSEATLSQSFRFGEGIAEGAWKVLSLLGATHRIKGNPALSSDIGPVMSPTAILCRSNAGVMARLLSLIEQKKRCHVVGGTKDLQRLLRAVSGLKQGIPSELPEFVGFKNWEEVVLFADEEEGASLKTFVQLVTTYGEERLLTAVSAAGEDEQGAEVILSTAHKAKGREWPYVLLDDDFDAKLSVKQLRRVPQLTEQELSDLKAELRLFYVALTRATQRVQPSHGAGTALGLIR